jgi:hypothetical protein
MRTVRGIRRSKAGAMETLSVVILAVAGIVIAAMVWAFLSSTVGMQQTSADFTITSVEVRQMSSGPCRAFIVIRNNGGQSFNQLQVQFFGPGGSSSPISEFLTPPLNPGQMLSRNYPVTCPSTWVAGTTLLVSVTLTTATGIQVTKNVNTIIQYGA